MTHLEHHPFPALVADSGTATHNAALRSCLLRVAVAVVLISTLLVDDHQDLRVHAKVVAAYCAVTGLALMLTWFRRMPAWLHAPLVAVDAALVVALFHEHMFAGTSREHDLTAPNISVAFILLLHAALSLRTRTVFMFSSIFLGGWLGFAVIAILLEGGDFFAHSAVTRLRLDGVLAAVFMLAVLMVLLLIEDHNRSLARAVRAEFQRGNLQRFFAPEVAAEIARKGLSLGLAEREASVMFVDLRAFTRFSERATGPELASILSDFRAIVSESVFSHGGTIDKFIGDAVLAIFGAPTMSPNDRANALACAQVVAQRLQDWQERNLASGKPALHAGVGLHHGAVQFGVIASGRHAELTVLGDVVNVAQRLEQATKALGASVVVSGVFSSEISNDRNKAVWRASTAMRLPGRRESIDVFYFPRAIYDAKDGGSDTRTDTTMTAGI